MIDSALKNAKILIVDDKQENIDLLTGLLEAKGYTNYKYTTDSRNVVDLFSEYQPDLLLLDLQMPHLNGFQVLIQLKVLIPEGEFFPILVLTADVTPESKLKALSSGATDFLTKPFDLIEVELRIKNLLRTRFLYQQIQNQNQILEEKVKERTKELEKLNSELIIAKEKAEEMNQVKNYFLSNMSHELRTPLISVLGFTELLQNEITDPEHLEMLNNIKEGGERLNFTLNSLLELSKLEAEKNKINIEKIELNNEIKKATESLKQYVKSKRLFLREESSELNIKVNIDCELFQKALFQILHNAIKFTKEGGVFVSTNLEKKENCDWAVIKVIDTGIGISKDCLNKIFTNFRQASEGLSRSHEGSGVGLSIAKKIIELMKGHLEVESEVGKGSTFSIWLPAILEGERLSEIIENKTRTISFKVSDEKIRTIPKILIVEDNPLNRSLLKMMLKNKVTLMEAEDGASSIVFARNNKFDLILMDINLGEGIDGIETMYQIRKIPGYMNVPIFAVTAYAMPGDKERFLKEGFDEYLQKPFTKELLLDLMGKRLKSKFLIENW